MGLWLSMMFAGALTLTDPTDPALSRSNLRPIEMLFTVPERRVRAADSQVLEVMKQGVRRSPTFASLLIALNRSDVIVYIERVMTLPKGTMGRLTMVPIPGQQRYLRIQIQANLSRNEAIALIGHEMRHALEVAEATDVRDADGMIRLYERIGHVSGGEHMYDTSAAQDTGRQVRRELIG
jgi:hypothetical protein